MNKTYIKMNNNEEYLSLGNIFRIMKEESKSKLNALQSEIFYSLFDGYINDTTINNYCVGIRAIGDTYKQIMIHKQKKYEKNKEELKSMVLNCLHILEGRLYENLSIEEINQKKSFQNLSIRLYNLSKNDKNCPYELKNKLKEALTEKNYYAIFIESIFYAVLQNKQPLYEKELQKTKIEALLQDSCLSYKGLEEYLLLTLNGNVNHDFTLKKLASEGNVYASYEMGIKEYNGLITGKPRYVEAYNYLSVAAESGHAGALYTIGNLFLKKKIGENQEEKAYKYLQKAMELGSVAAINSLGLMYLKGIYVEKNLEKAKKYFNQAALKECVYACNNLGKIMEKEKNFNEAFKYFLKSANLGESWACNQVGEYYRKGIITKDLKKAYFYYEEALKSDYKHICYFAYYNLAVYFFKEGNIDGSINEDKTKYKEYLEIASKKGILKASMELFYSYYQEYLEKRESLEKEKVLEYKEKIELHKEFNKKLKEQIETDLKKIEKNLKIEIEII